VPTEPIRLSRTFGNRRVDALISPIGSSLQSLVVDGLSLVRGDPHGPVAAAGAVLAPWPNRVRAGRWMLEGELQQLDITEHGAGNALHGLVASTPFSVTTLDGSSVELATRISRPPGYPFELDIVVSYRLVPTGIRSTIAIVNRTDRPAPVAVGVHPYLHLGDAPASAIRVRLDADRTLLLGSDNLPAGMIPVNGTRYDLRAATSLAAAPVHAAYTGFREHEGRLRLLLDDAKGGNAAHLWADRRFRWVQLYVTPEFPGLRPGEVAVALEPMTAPPDALNSGEDLHWLHPRARWTLDWGIDRL
jgi:aldose 1-epimerase